MAEAPSTPAEDAYVAEVEAFVSELRTVCRRRPTRVLLQGLAEMYARVLSECVLEETDREDWLASAQRQIRGWWMADRGGSFRPQ